MRLVSTVDPETMRHAMRRWSTGVTIVTSTYEGTKHGMTVSSFTSVALQPPMVLVSLEQGTQTHAMVQNSQIFGITILNLNQQSVSDRFAGREVFCQDRFEGIETFTLATGSPFLRNGLAFFDCRVVSSFQAGNHTVYLGEVLEIRENDKGSPLIYYDRQYWGLASID